MTWLRCAVPGWLLAAAVLLVCLAPHAGIAQTCTKEDFAKAVDEAGAALRDYNSKAAPQLSDKLRQLRTRKGWKDDDYERMALDHLHDARIAGLDQKANELLAKVDELGTTEDTAGLECGKLAELKASSLELLAVMKAKSKYLIGKIDAELDPSAAKAKSPPPIIAGGGDPDPADRMIMPPAEPQLTAPPPKTVERSDAGEESARWGSPTTAPPEPPWGATTRSDPGNPRESGAGRVPETAYLERPPGSGRPDYRQSAEPGQQLPPLEYSGRDFSDPEEEGYTIEEIQEATRGFFGSISTNLAAVIEHAFRSWGRPTGYVLGSEGGGALLAGLRYGEGTLYLRRGNTRTVYWHGPSVGYDIGAESSRTMFLIYQMHDPEQLFRRFIGVDGSAYLVGGVGVTLLKGGPIIMAPIRTGLGLRVGANVGYVRFTPEATWNPF